MRRPEEVRLPLASDDDYLIVKKHLTAGEYRRAQIRMMKELVPGQRPTLNPEEVGVSFALEYLLDWSIQDPDGKTIPIRDVPSDQLRAVLLELDPEKAQEIFSAIDAHNAAMEAERESQKKMTDGGAPSSPTYASVAS